MFTSVEVTPLVPVWNTRAFNSEVLMMTAAAADVYARYNRLLVNILLRVKLSLNPRPKGRLFAQPAETLSPWIKRPLKLVRLYRLRGPTLFCDLFVNRISKRQAFTRGVSAFNMSLKRHPSASSRSAAC